MTLNKYIINGHLRLPNLIEIPERIRVLINYNFDLSIHHVWSTISDPDETIFRELAEGSEMADLNRRNTIERCRSAMNRFAERRKFNERVLALGADEVELVWGTGVDERTTYKKSGDHIFASDDTLIRRHIDYVCTGCVRKDTTGFGLDEYRVTEADIVKSPSWDRKRYFDSRLQEE